MGNIIEVRNLSKTFKIYKKKLGVKGSLENLFRREYEQLEAVKEISLNISKGEFVGLIGPNGAGKTTTLKCLSGLIKPTSGEISVLGFNPIERKREYLKRISFVMGNKSQLWWDLPAMETLELTKVIYDIPQEDYNNRVEELIELLDLKKLSSRPVRELSLGQRMKFELINSLIYIPEVIFLDEPTLGLDIVMQERIRGFLKKYNKKYGSTIILTSHYMADVESLCSRVILINKGMVLFDGTIKKLKEKYSLGKGLTLEDVVKGIFNK